MAPTIASAVVDRAAAEVFALKRRVEAGQPTLKLGFYLRIRGQM